MPSSPTTMLGYVAARTEKLILSTSTTLITTNDPVKIAEDYAMLQHLADGRVDLVMGRGNTGPVYPWFGKDIREGINLAGLGGHVYMRHRSQDAVREFRPFFDHSPVMGGGISMEEYMEQTPLTVGTPEQVIEKTLTFREYFGDYQRQLFIVDGGGVPHKAVLEQIDMLGEEVVPVLRREFARNRPVDVPDAPTHATLLATRDAEHAPSADPVA